MDNKDKKNISRRDFFKTMGAAGLATAGLAACAGADKDASASKGEKKPGGMTYRTNPTTGDRVSLLGYGCMRWPMRPKQGGKEGEEEVDQETVNALVDYAIAHGVNYFDTSPAYVRGLSETVTGIALSRYPRDKYFIATKMSNFSPATQTRQGSIDLYHNSMKALQVDYIDYYLLHGIGLNGMPAFEQRFVQNGILDYLAEERAAGRIRNLGFSYHGDVKVFDYLLSVHDKYKWDFVQIQLNYVDWKHASGWNTNAEYLYNELQKRGIPAVVMEPLLGGRLSNMAQHLAARLKQHRPEESVASWAFRFAGSPPGVLTVLSGMTYMEHLQDNVRTYSPLEPANDTALSLRTLHRMPVLHALPLRHQHPRHLRPLQQVYQRRQRAVILARRKLPQGAPCLSCRLRPERAPSASGEPLHRLPPVRASLPAKHQDTRRDAAHRPLCGTTETGDFIKKHI